MLYLSYRGLCFGWGWNCYLLLEGFEDAPEGYSFRCNCFLKDWLELLLSLLTSSTNLSINLPRQPENRSPRIKSSIFVVWELRDYNKILEKAGIKIIDFDDFVFCTTESKSITLIPTFSQKTTSRSDENHKYRGLDSHTSSVYSPRQITIFLSLLL